MGALVYLHMEKIVLEVESKDDAKMILDLAKRLDAKVVENKYDAKGRIKILRKIAAIGNLKKQIPDPAKWQQKEREDRDLLSGSSI